MKRLAIAASAILSVFALAAEEYGAVSFQTTGPDRYEDGTPALPGECYALVWTDDDNDFDGFNVDGTCKDPNDKIVIVMPWATEKSSFPATMFNIATNSEYIASGKLELYLLDTRKYVDGVAKVSGVDANGKLVFVNAASKINEAVTVNTGATAPSSTTAAEGTVGTAQASALPDGIKAPKIDKFEFVTLNDKDYVKLTVSDTDGRVNYAIQGGDSVAVDGKTGSDVKTGVGGSGVITLLYEKGKANFFKVIRK